MKFEQTYNALLQSFPEQWRSRAMPYSQLRTLINEVARELSLLGLYPAVPRKISRDGPGNLISDRSSPPSCSLPSGQGDDTSNTASTGEIFPIHMPYKVPLMLSMSFPVRQGDAIKSRLLLTLSPQSQTTGNSFAGFTSISPTPEDTRSGSLKIENQLAWENSSNTSTMPTETFEIPCSARFLESAEFVASPDHIVETIATDSSREIVISLNSDSAFYRVLVSALQSLAEHRTKVQEELTQTVQQLRLEISNVSRPSSSKTGKSDLYAWRQIFQMWVDAQIFESTTEKDRGERSIEDSKAKLADFVNKIVERGLGDGVTLRRGESRGALERFLQINKLLLDVKKFQLANSEARWKIMKKHDKWTALSSFRPNTDATNHPMLSVLLHLAPKTYYKPTLLHLLLALLTETLLPIIPSIDDYNCLICTSIAYIPIRLSCTHIFCVRCLVKMQKRGQDECPLCRAPTVLRANRRNVDTALKRFMLDWFPKETKEKDSMNQREAAQEQARELGMSERDCCCGIM